MSIAVREKDSSVFARPIEALEGVGGARAKYFKLLGVSTLGDLLEYFPHRYQDESAERIEESKFRPIYPATAKLPTEMIQKIVEANLDEAVTGVEEWFKPELVKRRKLLPRREAYRAIHRPADMTEAMRARRRIV